MDWIILHYEKGSLDVLKFQRNIQYSTCEYCRNCADIVQDNDLFTLVKHFMSAGLNGNLS